MVVPRERLTLFPFASVKDVHQNGLFLRLYDMCLLLAQPIPRTLNYIVFGSQPSPKQPV
ncbi:uncharacterized protein METZ01_LOCUS293351 [marine metagenome]|uniref:Uncharacterized protein n=1 Tax=marine metagenome TaxID=408172 RepID=A0A382LYQ3_9ZZZZ